MPAAPAIRRATPHDVDALAELRLAMLREIGDALDEARAASLLDAIRRYLLAKLATGEFVAWVAEAEGRLVATSGLVFFVRPPDADNPAGVDAYLMNMYTLPRWRGRGLASQLMDEAIRFAKGSAARRIWLHATEEGRPVYRKAGFLPTTKDMELVW